MKLVILDRDGVINEDSDDYIKSEDEWIPIPGSLEAIAQLNQAGYHAVVVSNQSGIARGLFTYDDLHRMHAKMNALLAQLGGHVDAVLYCPHHPDDGCPCRKPAPGLLLQLAERLSVDLRGVPLVGDTLSDVQAASQVGAAPVMVRTGRGLRTLDEIDRVPEGVKIYNNLAEFAEQQVTRP